MEEIKLNEGQQKASYALMSGKNIFLTGAAGTGKSTVLKKFLKDMEGKGKNIIVTATTGIASTLLNGATFHRAFGYKADIVNPNENDRLVQIHNNLIYADIVVIDEISMMRRDIFDLFCKQRKIVLNRRQQYIKDGVEGINPNIQVIVVGDFTQLKPVYQSSKKSMKKIKVLENGIPKEYVDKQFCRKYYKNFNNGYCFSSEYWDDLDFEYVALKEVVRLKDKKFSEILDKLRVGDSAAVNELNSTLSKVGNKVASDSIILCATNKEADYFNDAFLSNINSEMYIFNESVNIYDPELYQDYNRFKNGDIDVDPLKQDRLSVPNLKLKVGARVMCLINDNDDEQRYQNGSTGYVTGFANNGDVEVQLDNGNKVTFGKYCQQVYTYDSTKSKAEKIVIAEIIQIPLKLAYAVTVHKSQGQTFDKVTIKPDGFFDEGHVIVAVSRCNSLEGMSLTSDLPLTKTSYYGIEDLPLVAYEVLEFNRKHNI